MYDKKEIYFEHRHYSNSMRAFDDVDRFSTSHDGIDAGVYKGRKNLPVAERLKI
jgi:hypothetical protein